MLYDEPDKQIALLDTKLYNSAEKLAAVRALSRFYFSFLMFFSTFVWLCELPKLAAIRAPLRDKCLSFLEVANFPLVLFLRPPSRC